MPLVTGLFVPSHWAVACLVFALIIQYQPLFRTDVQQLRKIDAGVKNQIDEHGRAEELLG